MTTPLLLFRRSRAFTLAAWLTRPLRQRLDVTYLYHFDLRRPVPDVRAEIPVEMKRATRAEVEQAARLGRIGSGEKFLARFDDGMACFVARIGSRVVAYNWTWYGSGRDGSDVIELGPREIFTYDAFTDARFRGHRIHTETLAYMLREARGQGYLDAYTMASFLNPWSRKTLIALGWRLVGRVLRVRIGGKPFRVIRLRGSTGPLKPRPAVRADPVVR